MSDLVKLYNPANSASLTPDQLEGLQKLSSPEIKELAQAYPNMSMQRAFLLIKNSSKPLDKQLATLSSYENLWNLREKNGLRQYVAVGFKGNYKTNTPARTLKTEVMDLSEVEMLNLPGFKKDEPAQEVKVRKIRKTIPRIKDPLLSVSRKTKKQ